MPRHRRPRRSPRYAPEPLEARLNPSPVGLPTGDRAAEVHVAEATADVPAPPADPGDPPVENPGTPIGPALPA